MKRRTLWRAWPFRLSPPRCPSKASRHSRAGRPAPSRWSSPSRLGGRPIWPPVRSRPPSRRSWDSRWVVVENRGGAGGAVGNAAVARAEPDGHTLLMTLSSLAVLPESERLFGRAPAYEVTQLAPVARVLADPTLLAVPASAPWRQCGNWSRMPRSARAQSRMGRPAPMAPCTWPWRCLRPRPGSNWSRPVRRGSAGARRHGRQRRHRCAVWLACHSRHRCFRSCPVRGRRSAWVRTIRPANRHRRHGAEQGGK